MLFNLQRDRPLTSQYQASEIRKTKRDLKSDRPLLKRSFLEDEESGYFKFLGDHSDPQRVHASESSEQENPGEKQRF